MANRFMAYNSAFSTATDVGAGLSYVGGTAKAAIQLATPATLELTIIEWGISFDGSAAATPALVELAVAGAASTLSTTHSTTTVQNIGPSALSSKLTFSTSTTAFGNGNITTNTTAQVWDKQYIAPTGQYVKMWPLGREPVLGASKFLQIRIKAVTTVNALAYIVWEER